MRCSTTIWRFCVSGIIGIYRTWALSDGSVPIERVSEVANDLTLNGLSSPGTLAWD